MANRIIQETKNFSVGPDAPADPNDVSVPNQVKPKGRIAQEMPAPKGRIATEMAGPKAPNMTVKGTDPND